MLIGEGGEQQLMRVPEKPLVNHNNRGQRSTWPVAAINAHSSAEAPSGTDVGFRGRYPSVAAHVMRGGTAAYDRVDRRRRVSWPSNSPADQLTTRSSLQYWTSTKPVDQVVDRVRDGRLAISYHARPTGIVY